MSRRRDHDDVVVGQEVERRRIVRCRRPAPACRSRRRRRRRGETALRSAPSERPARHVERGLVPGQGGEARVVAHAERGRQRCCRAGSGRLRPARRLGASTQRHGGGRGLGHARRTARCARSRRAARAPGSRPRGAPASRPSTASRRGASRPVTPSERRMMPRTRRRGALAHRGASLPLRARRFVHCAWKVRALRGRHVAIVASSRSASGSDREAALAAARRDAAPAWRAPVAAR